MGELEVDAGSNAVVTCEMEPGVSLAFGAQLLSALSAGSGHSFVASLRRCSDPPLPGSISQPNLTPGSLPGAVATKTLLRLRQLSVRESEIISLIREGLSSRLIAERLNLSELTVSTHPRNLLHKLNLHGVAELLQFAHEHGL